MLKFNTGNYWDGSVRRIELSFGLHKFIGSSKKERALVWAFSGHFEMLQSPVFSSTTGAGPEGGNGSRSTCTTWS